MNKIWVLTYTIGTNKGRKQRRLTCDTKEQAEMQQAVLGGEVVEYLRQPESFIVNWQNDNAERINEVIERLNKSQTWQELYCCRVEPETEEDRICANEHVKDLIVDEISCLIDDMSNDSPIGVWERPGSSEWDCAKVQALNNLRKLLNAIR